jgi:hypothetical protein
MARRSILLAALALLVVVGATSFQALRAAADAPAKPEPGKPVADLQLTVDRAAHGVLEISFQNVGKAPMVLNLGVMEDGGRNLIPRQLHLLVTGTDGESRVVPFHEFALRDLPTRIDDFLIPLMPGAKYTMTFALNDFAEDSPNLGLIREIGTHDKIEAVYKGAAASTANEKSIPNMPIWKGKVESAAVTYAE